MRQQLYILIFLFSIIFNNIHSKTEDQENNRNTEWGYNYEQTDTFIITNTAELFQFARMVNNENKTFQNKLVALIPDNNSLIFDLSFYSWQPIGSPSSPFLGTFDGNSVSLSGLSINEETKDYIGFFGFVGTESLIINVTILLSEKGIIGGNRVGGLAGACYGQISNCSVTNGEIYGKGYSVGGLVGSAYPGSSVTNSHSDCHVKATNVVKTHIGGLVGYQDNCSISKCYAIGSITIKNAKTSDVGGLVGYQKKGLITNCYSSGSILIEGAKETIIGGLVGKQCDQITESYTTTKKTAKRINNSSIGELAGKVIMLH